MPEKVGKIVVGDALKSLGIDKRGIKRGTDNAHFVADRIEAPTVLNPNRSKCVPSGEKLMRRNSIVMTALALVALFIVAGCSGQPLSTREKGTLGGAGIGAATGAIIGAAVGAPGVGAAIGGALGGVTGYAIGNEMQNNETANQQTQQQMQSQQQQIEEQRRQIQQLQQQKETE
jgi:osmotically inducible lipoprotein OsmB